MVSIGSISYLGSHGAELLRAGWTEPVLDPSVERVGAADPRVRARGGHRRAAPSARAARGQGRDRRLPLARRARRGGGAGRGRRDRRARPRRPACDTHWGRKVLEVRPPVRIDKGAGIVAFLEGADVDAAIYVGDDITDLDAFRGLDRAGRGGPARARAPRRGALRRGAVGSSPARPTSSSTAPTACASCWPRWSAELDRRAVRRLPAHHGAAQRGRGERAGRGDASPAPPAQRRRPAGARRRRLVGGRGADRDLAGAARRRPRRRSRRCWPSARTQAIAARGRARAARSQPPVAAAGLDDRRRRARVLAAAGPGDRGRLRDHLGARPGGARPRR